MPESSTTNLSAKTEPVVYSTSSNRRSSHTSQRHGGGRRASNKSEPSNASDLESVSLRVSALGSDANVLMPSSNETSEQIDDVNGKISLIRLSESINVVCVTETKGHIRMINEIAKKHNAKAVIHTGDFGFHDADSYRHLNIKELRHAVHFGPINGDHKSKLLNLHDNDLRKACENVPVSELSLFISGQERLEVPVYAIHGNQEDVHVLKKFADGSYHVPNLYLLNPDASFTIPLGLNHSLRLFGVGGALLYHRLFDIGQGTALVSGADGVMWATLLQIGNLIELSERYKDPNEIRILVSHVSPGKEALVNVLASAIHADFTLSGALHGKFTHAYTDFSVRSLSNYLEHLSLARLEIPRIWKHVQDTLGPANIRESDTQAVERVMEALRYEPKSDLELKHIWHLNLTDAKNGHLVLKMANDELKLEPVVEYGWHLSVAKDQRTQRRPSSKGRERRSEPKITSTADKTETKAIETTEFVDAPVPAVASLAEKKELEGAFVLRFTGFKSEVSQAEVDRLYAFKHFKITGSLYLPTEVQLAFEDEREFSRVIKSVSSMRVGGEGLTVEVIRGPEAVALSPRPSQSDAPKPAVAGVAAEQPKAAPAPIPEPATVDSPSSPTTTFKFGQRRAVPDADLNIDGLTWG